MEHPRDPVLGRAERFEILFDSYCDEIRRFAIRRVGVDRADEVVSATFLVAWKRLEDIPVSHELEWLYVTARNVILTDLRAERRRDGLVQRLGRDRVSGLGEPDHADAVAERDLLLRALNRQTPADQEVLRLAAWEGLSPDAAARALGCTRTAYKVRLYRARKRLSEYISAAEADLVHDIAETWQPLVEKGTNP
jgi:RNA polymerase sigma factor (sigma-70 family)